jgi:hypothetical protein
MFRVDGLIKEEASVKQAATKPSLGLPFNPEDVKEMFLRNVEDFQRNR